MCAVKPEVLVETQDIFALLLISHECTAIAFLPLTMHRLMELCKIRSKDEFEE